MTFGRPGKRTERSQLDMFGAVTTLMNGAQYDARRRFDILTEEINHLLRYLRYRIGPSTEFDRKPGGREEQERSFESRKPYDSQQSFLVRLGYAALALQEESLADGSEASLAYESFKSLWRKSDRTGAKDSEWLSAKRELLGQQVLWISKFFTKASIIAERLGELHDRLQQFLQRTNPDHPEPTLRRRLEHGLADKYLSELTRWVHKDIAELCSERYAGKYPMESVPSTFQLWGYGHASSHHSFVTLEEHKRSFAGSPPPVADSLDQPRFTTIAFSYWIPERPALAPLIGHEIARQVLRTIYGRNTQGSVLEQDRTALGEAYRSLIGCAEQWLAESVDSRKVPAELPMDIATEVLCDALAATRFGWSYVYALALQMMSDKRFAALFEDSAGMLMRISAASGEGGGSRPSPVGPSSQDGGSRPAGPSTPSGPTAATDSVGASEAGHGPAAHCDTCKALLMNSSRCSFCAIFSDRDRDARTMSAALKKDPPLAYYRGRALLSFVQRIHPVEHDTFARELSEAFECLLDAIHSLFTGDEPDRRIHGREFAVALSKSLCQTGPWASSSMVHNALKFVARTRSTGEHSSFVNPAMARQTLSPSFRSFLTRRLEKWLDDSGARADEPAPSRQSFGPKCCPGLVDAVWRIEWLVATRHKTSQTQPELRSAQGLRRSSREVIAVGIDDYLFRTGSPITLFETLNEGEPPREFSRLLDDHNKLHNMKEAYSLDPLKHLEEHLAHRRSEDFKFLFPSRQKGQEVPVVVGHERLDWLPDLVVDVDWHNRWLTPPPDVEVRESIVILDLLCLKSELHPDLLEDEHIPARNDALDSLAGELSCDSDRKDSGDSPGVAGKAFASTPIPDEQAESKERQRYVPFASGSLLGRYDAFVFYTQGPTDTVPPTSAQWSWNIGYGRKPNKDVLTAYVSRSKRLVRVWGPKSDQPQASDDENVVLPLNSTCRRIEDTTTLGLVLVSLKWDASRTLVGRWLAQHVLGKPYGLTWAVFLSDGWEDLVVVAGVPKDFPADQIQEKYGQFVSFVEQLNKSPFISSTETLFTQELLRAQPASFSFRFTVRLGRQRHEKVLERIRMLSVQYASGGGTAELRNVAGNRDIDVLVHSAPRSAGTFPQPGNLTVQKPFDLATLHLEMRRALSGYARFETRVAWEVKPDGMPVLGPVASPSGGPDTKPFEPTAAGADEAAAAIR